MLDIGTRAVLAIPILVFDRTIGVFGLHRSEAGPWLAAEISLAEAVESARARARDPHSAAVRGERAAGWHSRPRSSRPPR